MNEGIVYFQGAGLFDAFTALLEVSADGFKIGIGKTADKVGLELGSRWMIGGV